MTTRAAFFALALAACGSDGDPDDGGAPTPTPPAAVGASFQNPAPFSTRLRVTFEDPGRHVAEIEPVERLRGAAAVDRIRRDWGISPSALPDGFEHLVVRVRFTLTESPQSSQYRLFSFDFDAFNSSGAEYPLCACLEPQPQLEGDVFPGGTLDGWVALSVRLDDARPVMTFGRDFRTGRGGGWWRLYD